MSTSQMRIRPFQPGDGAAFRDLNEEWIIRFFRLEEQDRITLGNPELVILQPGGHIFMALHGEKPVACSALLLVAPGVFELGKMAVSPDYRGRGLGRRILEHSIAEARKTGAESVHLVSNSILSDAVHLYESVGFQHVPPEHLPTSHYSRGNVFMNLIL